MAKAWLSTSPEHPFDDISAGLVALCLAAIGDPAIKLIVEYGEDGCYQDVEYAIVDGEPRQVVGSPRWWDRQDRPGERHALAAWIKEDRYRILQGLLGGRCPTQTEMDLITDFVQWLGTPIGSAFMGGIIRDTNAALLTQTH